MAKKFDDSDCNNIQDPLSFIQREKNRNSMIVSPIDVTEIAHLISKLDNKKSCGYDLVSNSILKASHSAILPYLALLFNQCILEGVFSRCF